MKIRLGYIASPTTLENYTYSKTITYTNYQKLAKENKKEKLLSLTKENLNHLNKILHYNKKYGILFYRLSHNIVPLATHPSVSFDFVSPFQKQWQKIGEFIKKNKMRIDTHPNQFYVLNSVHPSIVKNTILGLEYHYQLFQALQIDSFCILHIGSAEGGKKEAIKRFEENFLKLPSALQKLILLENDDKIFTIVDTLTLCEKLKIPMVLDYHHYLCHHEKEKIEDYLPRIFKTWEQTNLPPKIHFSSPKNKKEKRSHSYYIDLKGFLKFIDKIKKYHTDVDVMLECKGKDESLFRLIRQLQFFTNFHFVDKTTFEIDFKNDKELKYEKRIK